tara:strand:+ start:146 stop:433 length:288 start_codon:yes stop_codon:yes gene_type:complete
MITFIAVLKTVLPTCKIIIPFFIPSFLSISTHFICEYIGCNEWYSLLGYNLACNACIDAKKMFKDNQVNMYWSIGSVMVSKMNSFIDNDILNKIN